MNYLSSFNNNLAYILAVEKLFGIEVTPRAKYFRVILAELSRISDHLVSVGTQTMDLGAFTVLLYLWRERENIYNLFESLTGTRLTLGYARVGGFARDRDIPPDFFAQTRKVLDGIPHTLDDVEKLLSGNRIWLDRTVGVGVITKEAAVSYGITGPSLRASGVPWDIRVAEPYSGYEDFDFDIAIADNGDVNDRYSVRLEEILQSIRIIIFIEDSKLGIAGAAPPWIGDGCETIGGIKFVPGEIPFRIGALNKFAVSSIDELGRMAPLIRCRDDLAKVVVAP
jgi:NADH:ubiquinone oxidoreductase subunit D